MNSNDLHNLGGQGEIKIERSQEIYDCYYCDKFSSTTNQREYEKHVVLTHNNKPAYPSLADLKRMNIAPKGRKWEV